MYKLLIADDERLERSAIFSAVEQTLADQFELRETENGMRAVEISKEFLPDIILMDIKMPVMNGIEAAKEILAFHPDCKIIMLTGFAYFNYAKECVSIGAMDFLVKPSTDEVIVKMLTRAIAAVDAVREKQQTLRIEQEKLLIAAHYLESELLVELFFCGADEERIDQILTELDGLAEHYVVAILFPDAEYGTGGNPQRLQNSCKAAAIELSVPGLKVLQCGHYGRVYLLLCTGEQRPRSWYTGWMERFLRIVTARQNFIGGIGVSQTGCFSAEIPHLVQQAHKAYRKTNAIQFYTKQTEEYRPLGLHTMEQELCTLLRERRYTDLLSRLYPVMEEIYGDSPDPKGQLCELLMLLNRTAAETAEVEPSYPLYSKLAQMEQSEQVKRYAIRYVQNLIDRLISKENQTGDEWAKLAEEMLRKQYAGEISIEEVARRVGFSTYYFSRLFKQFFGMSFLDYVTELRIQKAKTLLRQPGAVVKEVCFQVGYSEPNYFTRVFKKQVGVTPTEYQKNANNANLC